MPASLTRCKDAPTVPGKDATQKDVAGYILSLLDAHGDCKERLRALNEVVR